MVLVPDAFTTITEQKRKLSVSYTDKIHSLQKDKMFSDFVKRELCVFEAQNFGFTNDPNVAIKIRNRSRQVLVNETYEQLVANPLI